MICVANMLGAGMGRLFGLGGCLDWAVVWTGRLSELGFMGLVGWAVICVANMLGAGMGRLFGLGGCLNWDLWD